MSAESDEGVLLATGVVHSTWGRSCARIGESFRGEHGPLWMNLCMQKLAKTYSENLLSCHTKQA